MIQANVLCSSHLYQLLQLCALILCLLTSSTFHLGLISAHQWLLLRGYLSWNYLSLAQRTTLAQLFLVAAARSSLHEHVHPPTASGSSELDIISFYQLCLDMDAPARNEIPKHLGAEIRMIKKKNFKYSLIHTVPCLLDMTLDRNYVETSKRGKGTL